MSVKKLQDHLDDHPAYNFYKCVRVFDPRQLTTVGHEISDYESIEAL